MVEKVKDTLKKDVKVDPKAPPTGTAPPIPPISDAPGFAPPETGTAEGKAPDTDLEAGPIPIRKINPKDVMGKKMKDVKIPSDCFTIIGTAHNLRDGESAFGPWSALVGEFEATRISDGQRFISTQCFVPGAAGDLLVTQVRKFVLEEIPPKSPEEFKKVGKTYKVTGETVEMALIVSVKESSRDGGQPYEYVIRPVVPVQKSDPLAALRERMMKTLPRLTAPAPALPAPPATEAKP